MPTLRFFRGENPLVDYRLHPGRVSIGRADTCDVALPGEAISRVHCIVHGKDDDWRVIDRSRHGTLLNGAPIEERAPLAEGDVLNIGPYRVRFSMTQEPPRATAPQSTDLGHEVLLAADDGLRVERAVLVIVSGPGAGQRWPLHRARVSVGGPGSRVALEDRSLVRDQCFLRISRGRVMIEPGRGPAWLDGARVRDITPLYAEEDFRLGGVVMRVERDAADERPTADFFGEMVGESRAMRRLFGTLRRMAGHHHSVLVVGESGTGKELIARGIHEHSSRVGRPFVALNSGGISPTLFESELFGHEKGAFTGADRRKDGVFHEADGGTLFLDEIGELPEQAQAKLLRVLETGEVRRVGSTEVSYPDVRIVAATNRDLTAEVRKGAFREDLFFRLAVLSVRVPSLRERPSDLPVLCRTLCRRLHAEAHVTPDALKVLARHRWPGNVRELRNVLTRAYVLGGPRIDADNLTFHEIRGSLVIPGAEPESAQDAERAYLAAVLDRHADNRSAAARELGIPRSSLHYKLRKHGLI